MSVTCEVELLLAIRINGVPYLECEHIARLTNGRLAATNEALQRWRIRTPSIAPIVYRGEDYYPLDAIPGLRYVLHLEQQELRIEIPPESFISNVIDAAAELQRDAPAIPGGFFNYDLLAQRTSGRNLDNGLFEFGGFNRYGVATGTILWQDNGIGRSITRLDTSWTQDHPDTLSRLQLGDNISRAGSWGRAVRYAGVQWRSNFDTQPGFVTFPQPSAAGIAALPSTVEVYVNNTQRFSQDVPSGPFEISNLPVVTGSGEVQLVVRDLLGRQQIVTQPYYASQSLLRSGLSDYAYEIGFVRGDYGLQSASYGAPFALATHRRGMSDRLTREYRVEVQADQQSAGIGGVYLWPGFGTGQAALVASRRTEGNGAQAVAGIEQVSRYYSWSAQMQASSPGYTQLGWPSGASRPRSTGSLRLGVAPGASSGSMSVAHVSQRYWGRDDASIWSLNYSRNLQRNVFLNVYAVRSASGADTSHSIGFSFSIALGDRTSGSAQFSRQGGNNDRVLQLQQNLPEGAGFGYRFMAGSGQSQREEASGAWQTNSGLFTAGTSQQDGDSTVRVGAAGGVAFLGGAAFMGRRIDDSFGVVNAGGYPGIRIRHENRFAGVTNDKGLALIPHLQAYQPNRISVEQRDLPIEAQATELDLHLVPRVRSGVYAEFPIRKITGGLLVAVLEDGSFVPAGAIVQPRGQAGEFPVGLRGEVFLPSLPDSNELLLTWNERQCVITLHPARDHRPFDALGPHTCKGIHP